MLNVPFTVPKAKASEINFLFRIIIPIDFLNSIFSTIELMLGKVGGFSLKNIRINIALAAAIMSSTTRRTKKCYLTASLESEEETKNGGIRNPTAVPMMFTTVKMAIAKDLWFYN